MGLCKYLREQAKCEYYKPEGGFDAVAAAVAKHFENKTISITYFPNEGVIYVHEYDGTLLMEGESPTPTAALSAACLKYNEEAEHE